ncbi:PMS2 [Symbiodinium sp. KB8]|nr:PMS2 [Symbiodinium sp. KB8]
MVLPAGSYDVNVTPDKREVILADAADVTDCLKRALHALWEPSRWTLAASGGGRLGSQRLDSSLPDLLTAFSARASQAAGAHGLGAGAGPARPVAASASSDSLATSRGRVSDQMESSADSVRLARSAGRDSLSTVGGPGTLSPSRVSRWAASAGSSSLEGTPIPGTEGSGRDSTGGPGVDVQESAASHRPISVPSLSPALSPPTAGAHVRAGDGLSGASSGSGSGSGSGRQGLSRSGTTAGTRQLPRRDEEESAPEDDDDDDDDDDDVAEQDEDGDQPADECGGRGAAGSASPPLAAEPKCVRATRSADAGGVGSANGSEPAAEGLADVGEIEDYVPLPGSPRRLPRLDALARGSGEGAAARAAADAGAAEGEREASARAIQEDGASDDDDDDDDVRMQGDAAAGLAADEDGIDCEADCDDVARLPDATGEALDGTEDPRFVPPPDLLARVGGSAGSAKAGGRRRAAKRGRAAGAGAAPLAPGEGAQWEACDLSQIRRARAARAAAASGASAFRRAPGAASANGVGGNSSASSVPGAADPQPTGPIAVSSLAAAAAVKGDAASRQAAAAEEELTRVLSKEAFPRMRVVGQFNLGFVVGRLGSDLFILDQHACDEKVRFELLQAQTKIHEQPLIAANAIPFPRPRLVSDPRSPRKLELPASEELTILEALPVFAANGFSFKVDEAAPAGRRIALVAVPFSKSTRFGEQDVHELASILADRPGRMARLPRIRAMFASRACRSAIMIGRPLALKAMGKLVTGMAELDQPWNCPHGRPTIRHLVDLNQVKRHGGDGAFAAEG